MYRYDEFDERFVRERVAQFRDQVGRRLSGSLTEDEFKPLRLKNGVYLQLHAYMLRIAVPYGTLSSKQMRQLALIGERYDRGYGHFTTRTNLQFNWPKLRDIPDILDLLADVEMHAIQTSGNCIRNVTADHFAGVAQDEVEDPRPTAELIRQWSSLHPEFDYLPRKFKIAVTGAAHDRAVIKAHDIGLRILRHPDTHEIGYEVIVGGGLGRTPMIGKVVRDFLPKADLLAYLEAIMRVYNLEGRRDNKYKARVKILVHEIGTEEFSRRVEEEFARLDGPSVNADPAEVARIAAYFAPPAYETLPATSGAFEAARAGNPDFARWAETNLTPHRQPGYAALTISLKPIGAPPGDATSEQMRVVADLADEFSLSEIRVTHAQNLVLPHVKLSDLFAVWQRLGEAELATANAGLITDIIACPGLDYCALATARSIPIAQALAQRFADPVRQKEIGVLNIKISGCINACGHHHVGHIGILGLEKRGIESYQITLGGDATENAAIGEILGPGLAAEDVPDAIERIVSVYLAQRQAGESFIDNVRRIGLAPFKAAFQEVSHAVA
ncbi:nitrite/sulfite reductase [Bosea sp. (in: a-proteobacteria)]|jgi:sulfite reductase (NADPH) hemoprotein beta-component|uniref:nitrite/sulfite reductase n=1 Tax=Bosea sp. (in: a-proteobacteria) TaxID=1871050 RepID=UPI001DE8FB0F|nr:nitrite/sulfite reductase [Bosea sp. (in: a-proteobacteria)]MBA4221118.1 sulfite reductase [Methylobacterium sp.]MBR3189861.1 nitrite/sulfite reductase [Bosea sp. (in: a-proteobacteria)]